MRTSLRNFGELLPAKVKKVIAPPFRAGRHWAKVTKKRIHLLFARQYLPQSIGHAPVPWLTRAQLKKSFAQQGEDLILDRILLKLLKRDLYSPGLYVDVGAYDAVEHSVTYLLYLRGWSGVVFDPSLTTKKSFQFWRTRDIIVDAVVGNVDGINVDFYLHNVSMSDQALGSTKYPSQHGEWNFRKITHRQVNLNAELKRQGVQKIDFLNLDVEGAELEILESLDFEFFKPSVIAIEIHGNDLVKCLQSDEARVILSKGYQAVGSAVITQFFVRRSEIID